MSATAFCWGPDDSRPIANAISVASAFGGPVVFSPGVYAVGATATVTAPSNVQLVFEKGATLAPFGTTVTVASFSANRDQFIFGVTGTFTLSEKLPHPLVPEWFGAVGNTSADDTAAVRACFTAATSFGLGYFQNVHLPRSYKITSTINIQGTFYGLITGERGSGCFWAGSFDDMVTNPIPMFWLQGASS